MRENVFNVELNRIQDQNVRASTELLLNMLPDYFFEIPASSSGKYHPVFSLGEGGLVRHVKVAMRILEEMFKDTAFGTYEDYTKDSNEDFFELCKSTLKREIKEEIGISVAINSVKPFLIYKPNMDLVN